MNEQNEPTPDHYNKRCSCGKVLDVYRISEIYGLNSMAHHIVKKGLCAGNRGHKDLRKDLQDIIATSRRWLAMLEEDEDRPVAASESSTEPAFRVGQQVRVKWDEHETTGEVALVLAADKFRIHYNGGGHGVHFPNELELLP